MEEINGFKVVPLLVKPNVSTHHTLYIKAHTIRIKDADKPAGRTLFIVNVPPYVTEADLRFGFKEAGEIVSILCQEKVGPADESLADSFTPHRGTLNKFKVAHIVFKSTKSLEKALQLRAVQIFDDETGRTQSTSGLRKWMQEYLDSLVAEDSLQAEIDAYMAKYDSDERAAQLAEKANKPDNDGWITVTKRGPRAGFEQKDSVINRLEEKIERSRKKKELKNFYTFQIRESKMQHIVSLRRKFEEDKRKVETLKKTRRFNPFNK